MVNLTLTPTLNENTVPLIPDSQLNHNNHPTSHTNEEHKKCQKNKNK